MANVWGGEMHIGKKVRLGQGIRLAISGSVTFGDNFAISANSSIVCRKNIVFGDNVLISWDCLIMDYDHHNIYSIENNSLLNEDRDVVFGNNIWIGCRCLILKGSRIGNNSIIAAGSKIAGNCKNHENTIIGDYGKTIKRDVYWKA